MMTITDIAGRICAIRGYCVIGSERTFEAGDTIPIWHDYAESTTTPLLVIGPTDYADHLEQERLWREIEGDDCVRSFPIPSPFYYRVVAHD